MHAVDGTLDVLKMARADDLQGRPAVFQVNPVGEDTLHSKKLAIRWRRGEIGYAFFKIQFSDGLEGAVTLGLVVVKDGWISHDGFNIHKAMQGSQVGAVLAGTESRLVILAQYIDDAILIDAAHQCGSGIGLAVVEASYPFPVGRGLEMRTINDDLVGPAAEGVSKDTLTAAGLMNDFLFAVPC